MGYPDNVLAKDEQLVLHRHPHWKRLIGPVVVLVIATGVAVLVAALVQRTGWHPTAKTVLYWVIEAIGLVLVGWLTVRPFLTWLTTPLRHHRSPGDVPARRADPLGHRHPARAWSTAKSSGTS